MMAAKRTASQASVARRSQCGATRTSMNCRITIRVFTAAIARTTMVTAVLGENR